LTLRGYIARRIIFTIVLVLFVIVLNWLIFEVMPGEQGALLAVQGQAKHTSAQYDFYAAQFGKNKPPLDRFVEYFTSMLTFNFGKSFQNQQPVVAQMISGGKLVNTLVLLGSSAVLSIVIGIFLGVVVSYKRKSTLDNFWVTTALTTFSLPTFWMGLSFIFIFSLSLGWFPPGGVVPSVWYENGFPNIFQQIITRAQYLFLPVLTLTLFQYGGYLLLTRATMIETLGEDYIVTARAKGLKTRTILFHHAFKNASLPIVTASALAFGALLGGAIITETVFNYPGLGRWLFDSIGYRDFPVMQAMFYILALGTIIANFAADLVYGVIDPRIKYQ